MEIPNSAGNYVLVLQLPQAVRVKVGAFGIHDYPAGLYCYCGSAHGPGGLRARLRRHADKNTGIFWHIDYLKQNTELIQVWWQVDRKNLECTISQRLAGQEGVFIPAAGFGTSDCRSGCQAHLIGFHSVEQVDASYKLLSDLGFNLQREFLA